MTAKWFKIHELVPPAIYKAQGEEAWNLIDPNLIKLIDALRERYGAATINNYEYGGEREWSGLRTPDSPWYSPTSQHTLGRAADILFKYHTAQEVRDDIMFNSQEYWLAICPYFRLEDKVSWLHIDVKREIKLFNP